MGNFEVYTASAAIGLVAGLRSMTAPAIVSRAAGSGDLRLNGTPLEKLGSPASANIFAALAAGELVADKLPFIPNRTDPGPLAARVASGGLCGAAICLATKRPALTGAVLGGLAAIGGAFLGYELRKRAAQNGSPDFAVALVEDAAAVSCGVAAVSSLR